MVKTNETYGMSTEMAIILESELTTEGIDYNRTDVDIIDKIRPIIKKIISNKEIPKPKKYVGERQSPVDFLLCDDTTLSVKTNQGNLGKVAPQKFGQPTSKTFFSNLYVLIDSEDIKKDIEDVKDRGTYEDRANLFKKLAIDIPEILLKVYWNHLFECDYTLYIFNIKEDSPEYIIFKKMDSPNWIKDKFDFTREGDNWNESTTIKYFGCSIGEFQIHNNRDCFKFRFIMKGILELIKGKKI